MFFWVNDNHPLFKYFVFFCLLVSSSYGQEVTQEEILNKLNSLKDASLEEYANEMDELGDVTAEYIRNKEQECSGEFSSLVIDDTGAKKRVRKKLSKKEKSLCLYLLIDFRIKVTKLSFEIRKNHLRKIQLEQLSDLEELQKKQVQELEKLAQKFR